MRQTQAILIEMTMKIKFRKQYKVQMLLEKRLSMVEDPGGLWSVLWARAVSESLMTGWSGKTAGSVETRENQNICNFWWCHCSLDWRE